MLATVIFLLFPLSLLITRRTPDKYISYCSILPSLVILQELVSMKRAGPKSVVLGLYWNLPFILNCSSLIVSSCSLTFQAYRYKNCSTALVFNVKCVDLVPFSDCVRDDWPQTGDRFHSVNSHRFRKLTCTQMDIDIVDKTEISVYLCTCGTSSIVNKTKWAFRRRNTQPPLRIHRFYFQSHAHRFHGTNCFQKILAQTSLPSCHIQHLETGYIILCQTKPVVLDQSCFQHVCRGHFTGKVLPPSCKCTTLSKPNIARDLQSSNIFPVSPSLSIKQVHQHGPAVRNNLTTQKSLFVQSHEIHEGIFLHGIPNQNFTKTGKLRQKRGAYCQLGFFGLNCSMRCYCRNKYPCDYVTGMCPLDQCHSGWKGSSCSERVCPLGFFGLHCMGRCECKNAASCSTLTGECQDGLCIANESSSCLEQVCPREFLGYPKCQEQCHCNYDVCSPLGLCPDEMCLGHYQPPSCVTELEVSLNVFAWKTIGIMVTLTVVKLILLVKLRCL